jgi:flavin-dependent dehydrogenase
LERGQYIPLTFKQINLFLKTRADFDDLLLKHAAESGASVYEGVRVTEIKFSAENPRQPVAAEWKSDQGSGEIKFSYLVDGSGRNGIMSTRYLKNRKFTQNPALKNIASWGYWKGAGIYMPGTNRENAPWFEALTGQDSTEFVFFLLMHFRQTKPVGCGSFRSTLVSFPSGWSFQKPPTRPKKHRPRT